MPAAALTYSAEVIQIVRSACQQSEGHVVKSLVWVGVSDVISECFNQV